MRYMPISSPSGYTTFCDDIRQEVGNKLSMVGVYTNGMLTPEPFPVVLPKFCMFVTYVEVKGTETEPVNFSIYLPGDEDEKPSFNYILEEIMEARKTAPDMPIPDSVAVPSHSQSILPVKFPIIISPAEFRQPGFVRVHAHIGDRTYKLGSLLVDTTSKPHDGMVEVVEDKPGR
jgi:hypothetical protein